MMFKYWLALHFLIGLNRLGRKFEESRKAKEQSTTSTDRKSDGMIVYFCILCAQLLYP